MLVGTGDLGTKVAMLLAHDAGSATYRVIGRSADKALRLANMCRLSALQCGKTVGFGHAAADLDDMQQFAEEVAGFNPHVVFTSASVQAWHGITALPPPLFEKALLAGYGPWLPMHLAPTLNLMRAIELSGCRPVVVNAAFPDAVHPALQPLGLSPHAGIGNVANYIPGLRSLVARDYAVPVDSVHVRFMAHHFVSFSVSRRGDTQGAPYHLAIDVYGEDRTGDFDSANLFRRLSREFPRTSGMAGQFMTAASAVSVLRPLIDGAVARTHSPGFDGRVGGWPVMIRDRQIELDLPDHLDRQEVLSTNEEGQVFDGIARFDDDGTAVFTDRSTDTMKSLFGYSCASLHPLDAPEAATELRARFLERLN